ncbi:MAG: site-specific integrase [Candidatus Methanomethylophilaceae archaeon]|nr:site-specific integrase [Candidatus Methanomethylophilaceae archaeon]
MSKNQFRTDSERYLEEIRGNYKESTFQEKRRKLYNFSRILYSLSEEKKISTCNPRKMTKEDVNAYVSFRRSKGISDSTIRKDLTLIGDLLRYVGSDAMDLYRVVYGNRKPRSYFGKLDPLPDETIEKVYALARSTDDWKILQGCVAIILGCAGGLRPQESRQLYVEDVHHLAPEPYIHIKHVKGEGKWGRERSAPLNDGVSDIIEKYVRMREEKLRLAGRQSSAFFPPLRSRHEFVSQQSMSRFKGYVAEALGETFVLKDGRRSYGQRMLDRGVPIEYVSYCMGHDSVETTQKYYASYRDRDVLSQVHGILSGRSPGFGQ